MKTKIIVLAAFGIFLTFLMACSGSQTNPQASTGEPHDEAADEHHHTYTCPMHPDVISDKPGSCPKCGMNLVHKDEETSKKEYFIQFAANPAKVEAGKEAALSFTPRIKGSESEPVPLDVVHEKKIHLIIVSSDLSYFEHIHPEYQADGSYLIKVLPKEKNYTIGKGNDETKFESGGDYFLFADYQPAGGNHTVDNIALTIEGAPAPVKKFTTQNLTASSGNYSVTLEPSGGRLVTNVLMHISGIVKKNGKELNANELENYLGEKAHVMMVGMDDKNFMHVHPSVGALGRFDLHATFEKPGIYRLWFQFQAEGKVHTLDYTLNVAQSTQKDIDEMNEAHSQHHLEEQEKIEKEKAKQ